VRVNACTGAIARLVPFLFRGGGEGGREGGLPCTVTVAPKEKTALLSSNCFNDSPLPAPSFSSLPVLLQV